MKKQKYGISTVLRGQDNNQKARGVTSSPPSIPVLNEASQPPPLLERTKSEGWSSQPSPVFLAVHVLTKKPMPVCSGWFWEVSAALGRAVELT